MTVTAEARQALERQQTVEITTILSWAGSLESWIAGSPLVEIELG
jgi:hypothetical protein